MRKIITQPDAYPRFGIQEGLIWTKNQLKRDVICIPQDTFQRGRMLIEIIIDHAHQTIGHYGQWKTLNYIRQSYWWPQMATDIEAFCRLCGKCQTNKTDMLKPQGFLHSLPIPDKLWWEWTSWDHCPSHKAMITYWYSLIDSCRKYI